LPLPDRTDIARRWLRWADEDFALAEHTAADPDVVARGACVWAHQAAEKALKALLILRDIDPPKRSRPFGAAPTRWRGQRVRVYQASELTRWAIEGRYPADMEEATHADGLAAISIARQVLDVVRPRIAAERLDN
jgi:HEPN domain-containing protein